MKTVVTIDLDYWTNLYIGFKHEAVKMIKECIKLSSKSYVIDHHHKILNYIPNDTERIVNIDFHNDILGESSWDSYNIKKKKSHVNEGTWGNFLPNSVNTFDWFYPSKKYCIGLGYGLCQDHYGYVHDDYPIENYTQNLQLSKLTLNSITNFVLCISPEWATMQDYIPYLESINIKYKNRTLKVK